MTGGWVRVRKGRPCPVCGKIKLCGFREPYGEASAMCSEADAPTVTGQDGRTWTLAKVIDPKGNLPTCRIYEPEGYDPGATPFARQPKAESRKAKARQVNKAARLYERAAGGAAHPRVREYLEARGIAVARLPGGMVPRTLRFLADCDEITLKDESRELERARDLLFSSLAPPEIVEAERLPDRIETPLGLVRIERVYDDRERKRYAWVSRRCPAMVAAIRGVEPDEGGRVVQGVHRTYLDPGGSPSKRGHGEIDAAKKTLGSIGSGRAIWLAEEFAEGTLIVAEGIETALACSSATGWGSASAIFAGGLEAFDLPPELLGGPEGPAVTRVVVAADLDRSLTGQRSAAKCAEHLAARFPGLEVVVRSPAEIMPAEELERREGFAAPLGPSVDWLDALRRFGHERVRAALVGEFAGPARGAREHAGDLGGDGGRAIAPDTVRDRARDYLMRCELPPKAKRWSIAYVQHGSALAWHRWDGACWRELPPQRLAAMVRAWLGQFYTVTRSGDVVPLNPKGHDVREVVESMAAEAWADLDSVPGWLPDTFDGNGAPVWSGARRFAVPQVNGRRADRLLSFRNGILDLDALLGEEPELMPHEPGLFVSSVLPYDLDIAALRAMIRGEADPADVYAEHCPALTYLMAQAGDGDDWTACCQAMLGDTMTYDRTLEKIFLIQGLPRSGKGTLIEALASIVGRDALAYTSFGDLADKFELAPLVGKKAAVMADAHVSDFADGSRSVERLKSISGGDGVRIRDLYTKANPCVSLSVRFWIFVNTLPDLRDPSTAMARRLVILPMSSSAYGREDYTLKRRVAAEGSGNALFALMGYFNTWKAERPAIEAPASGRAMAEEFTRSSSPLAEFLEDCCELYADAAREAAARGERVDFESFRVYPEALERAYGQWAESQGRQAKGRHTLGRELPSLVRPWSTEQVTEGAKRVRYWQGLRLRIEALPYAHG